jgi:hypothetical protein
VTASEKAKSVGLKSLAEMSAISGRSTQILNVWFNEQPDHFNALVLGCAVIKHKQAILAVLK